MKKIVFLLLITNCSLLIAQTGWVQQNSGTLSNLNSVFFVDANTGYTVGDSVGLKTTDGGSNWVRQNIGSLKSVFFLDANTGFVCGISAGALVLRTSNGGTNWN